MKFEDYQISQKGVNYVLHPARGKFSRINPDIGCTVTTHMGEWIGNFISPDIERVERPEAMIGSTTPTLIYQNDGTVVSYDGKDYREVKETEPKFIGNIYGYGTGYDGSVYDKSGVGATVVAQGKNGGMILEERKCIQAGELHGQYDKMFEQSRRAYDPQGAAPTQHTVPGGNLECKILEPKLVGGIGEKKSNGGTQYYQQDRVYDAETVAAAHCAEIPGGSYNYKVPLKRGYSVDVKEEQNDTDEIDYIGNYSKSNFSQTPIVGKNGVAPTFTENHGQVIAIKSATQQGYEEAHPGDSVDLAYPSSETRRGKVGEGVAQTLQTSDLLGTVTPNYRIRKLTPKECARLMGVKDEDSMNIAKNQSKSSQYHLSGDSICTNVLMAIFGEMLGIDWKSKVDELIQDVCKESE